MAKATPTDHQAAVFAAVDPGNLLITLQSAAQWRARGFLAGLVFMGYGKIRVTYARRSIGLQEKLYAQGRSPDECAAAGVNRHLAQPGAKKVTWTLPKDSYHVRALAFDLHIAEYSKEDWQVFGKLGKWFGFEWGGDWDVRDWGHFQLVSENGQRRLGL